MTDDCQPDQQAQRDTGISTATAENIAFPKKTETDQFQADTLRNETDIVDGVMSVDKAVIEDPTMRPDETDNE